MLVSLTVTWLAALRKGAGCRGVRSGLWGVAWAGMLLVAAGRSVAADPKIERIELYLTNKVTIHFYTPANRTTILQSFHYRTGQWSNLFSAPKFPFTNHYIIPDHRTNGAGLYRLKVIP